MRVSSLTNLFLRLLGMGISNLIVNLVATKILKHLVHALFGRHSFAIAVVVIVGHHGALEGHTLLGSECTVVCATQNGRGVNTRVILRLKVSASELMEA